MPPHIKNKPPGGLSKHVSERRLFEKDSDNSAENPINPITQSAIRKREQKNAKKQLLMMVQGLNPESGVGAAGMAKGLNN